jgi:hypothetical protein
VYLFILLFIGRAIKPAADNKETQMNANLFSKVFKKGFIQEADIPNVAYASEVLERHRKASEPFLAGYGPTIAHNRRVVAERSFTNASAPIFERDFPKFGVKPIERDAEKAFWANSPWPVASDDQILALSEGEPVDLSDAPKINLNIPNVLGWPKAEQNQKVFPLGGVPRAFLRAEYHIVPCIEWGRNISKIESIHGEVRFKSAEYLLEIVPGVFDCIAEWERVLPRALARIEESGRPNHKELGWSDDDLLEVSGEHPDNEEP